MANNTLVIVGMHRSGTSVITQWLHKCGLQVGDNLLGPDTGNIEGHFEDLDFVKFHEEMLLSKHLHSSGLDETAVDKIDNTHLLKLGALIIQKNSRYTQWGWKDPRTCLFLKPYRDVLPDARYLVILRDYKSVVSSLLKRDVERLRKKLQAKNVVNRFISTFRKKYNINLLYKTQTEKYLKVWIAYNEEILKHVEQLPANRYAVVDYKTLITEDKPIFLHLTQHWGFRLSYNSFNTVYKPTLMSASADIDAFIYDESLFKKAALIEKQLEAKLLQHAPNIAKIEDTLLSKVA